MRKSIDVDLALLERYDSLITNLELTIVREAKRHDGDAFHRLRSVPGIGKVPALTILYEIHDIRRFDRVQECASDARLVKCAHQPAGKTRGSGGAKMGNVHLKWAFSKPRFCSSAIRRTGRSCSPPLRRNTAKERRCQSSPTNWASGVLHALARDRLLDGEVPRGVGGREWASQSANSSHRDRARHH